MAIDLTTYRTHLDAARAALAAADYAEAESQALQAQTCLAGIAVGRQGEREVQMLQETLTDLVANIRISRRNAGTRGLRRTDINYAGETDE